MRRVGLLVMIAAALAACSDGKETAGPAVEAQRRIGFIQRVDRQRHIIDVDFAEFLTGAEAQEAFQREHGDDATLDSDYYVSNPSKSTTRVSLADDADIRVNILGDYPIEEPEQSTKVDFDTFIGYFQGDKHDVAVSSLFWIRTGSDGVATDVEQQYVP